MRAFNVSLHQSKGDSKTPLKKPRPAAVGLWLIQHISQAVHLYPTGTPSWNNVGRRTIAQGGIPGEIRPFIFQHHPNAELTIRMKPFGILLIDDDKTDCALFGMAVDKLGLNIGLQTVTDGEEAIDYLEGRGVYADRSLHPLPSMVVLDLDIRLAGGMDFLGWRRASALFSSLPVVILSAFAYKGAIEMALAMGANTLMATPFEFEDWKAVVRRIWDLGMQRSELIKSALAVGSR